MDSEHEVTSSYSIPNEISVTKLQETWPMVESALEEYDIPCKLNMADRSMTISTTKRSKNRHVISKARDVLELLSITPVPPSLAIEILNGCRKHILIKTGDQEGGLCSKFGIKKEDYLRRRECLFSSLQACADAVYCNVFINENTFTAVGPPSMDFNYELIRTTVEDCIIKNVCPETALYNYFLRFKRHIWEEDLAFDPHEKHLEMENSGERDILEMAFLYTQLPSSQAIKLDAAWPMVESSLKDYGISCDLVMDDLCVNAWITRRTGDRHIIDKAWDLLELFSKTDVSASMAIKILNGSLQHVLINIGYKDGGLCSRFGIKKEQFLKQRRRLKPTLKALASKLGCDVYVNANSVTVVGTSPAELRLVRDIVEGYMVKDANSENSVWRSTLRVKMDGLTKNFQDLCL